MLTSKLYDIAKRVGARVMPGLYGRLRAARQRRVRNRLDRITATFLRRKMLRVLTGPFRGMEYTIDATAAHYPPKVVGAYESELHEIIERVIASDYPAIVDVGCSEGYYAVGLAMRCANARVYAYDIDENSRRWCAQLAARNEVADRVSVRGECSAEKLEELGIERAFLLSDCEGFELQLLDPIRAPALRAWDILVELHDCYDPRTTCEILPRFAQTHQITMIYPARRYVGSYPDIGFLGRADRRLCISDLRADRTHWAFMQAKDPTRVLHGRSGVMEEAAHA